MDAEIYAEVLWLLHRELMEERNQTDPSSYPHVHLLHDRAPAHAELRIKDVLTSLNMSATLVTLTSSLQIFDVGLARVIRAGYLGEQTLYFRPHELKVGDLTFIQLQVDDSSSNKATRAKIIGPFRIHSIDTKSQTITVYRSASDLETYPCAQASNNVISKPTYRKLAVIFICNVWYNAVDKELIQKLATRTGQDVSLDVSDTTRSEEGKVDVHVGQSRVSFEKVRDQVYAEFDRNAPKAEPLTFDQKAFDTLKEQITQAAQNRRDAHKRKKKRSSKHTAAPPRKRGQPLKKQSEPKANSDSEKNNSSGNEETTSADDSSDLASNEDADSWMELNFLSPKQIRDFQSSQNVDLKTPLEVGELIVVAGSPDFEDTQTFYVGETTEPSDPDSGQFSFQFYNDANQDLYGKYAPAWLDTNCEPPKEDYCFKEKKKGYVRLTSWGLPEFILSRHVQLTSRTKKLPSKLESSLKQLCGETNWIGDIESLLDLNFSKKQLQSDLSPL